MSEKHTPRPRYITPEGFRRLAAEHQRIWTVLRPRVVAEVEAAAALGDRSENAEYIYGRRRLRELDRRLRHLAERMDALTVLDPRPHPSGRAYFGAWVTVEDERGEERTWRLVGPDEFDVSAGLLSVEAPLGRALLGRRAEEVVRVDRPAGPLELTVVEVRWQPTGEGAAGPDGGSRVRGVPRAEEAARRRPRGSAPRARRSRSPRRR